MVTTNYEDSRNGMTVNVSWQSATLGSAMNWQDALDASRALNTDGFDNWRLPTIQELQTILNNAEIDMTGKEVWSRESSDNYLQAKSIVDAGTITDVAKTEVKYVLAVRMV